MSSLAEAIRQHKMIFTITIIIKLACLMVFSSEYVNDLFSPFITHFINELGNPWEYFRKANQLNAFPYPPLMLYLLSIFCWLPIKLGLESYLYTFIKIPTLLADFLILVILMRLLPGKFKQILIFYFSSPILLYAVYIHSQLDLIPTAVLLCAIYLAIKNRLLASSLFFGCALSIKFHIIAAIPFVLIYLYKNGRTIVYHLIIPVVVYLFFIAPFWSPAFLTMVIRNAEQQQVFDIVYQFNELTVYLVPMSIIIIIARFFIYNKVNVGLLVSMLGLVFSVLLLLVPPMPGWYIWVIPFMTIYFVRFYDTNKRISIILSLFLCISYLIYFVCFHESKFSDILFMNQELDLKIDKPFFRNVSFTMLEGGLLSITYFLYRFGIKSNQIYKRKDHNFVIGVGGDSGAGKSTLLQSIQLLLMSNGLLEIEGDGDHKWERGHEKWKQYTHLNPKANHLHRQSEDLFALKNGEAINRVEYDHKSGRFTLPKLVKPNDYIVLSGLHPFYLPKMRKAIDLKIYVEPEEQLRRHWKISRDMQKRSYTFDQVMEQIQSRMPDAEKYIYPQKQFADLIINYFTTDHFEIGNNEFSLNICLRLYINANVNLDLLVELLNYQRVKVFQDYTDDMNHQYLLFDRALPNEIDYQIIADSMIDNMDEIVMGSITWKTGYHGVIQLVILLLISEIMKEEIQSES